MSFGTSSKSLVRHKFLKDTGRRVEGYTLGTRHGLFIVICVGCAYVCVHFSDGVGPDKDN